MKRHDLTRNDRTRVQRDEAGFGERLAADAYNYSTQRASNFDAARESGAVIEVKSTTHRYGNGRRGRFRLYQEQHERLTAADRNGSAWYVFVLFHMDRGPRGTAYMKRQDPAHVGRVVAGRGGWNGPRDEHQLPWRSVFDL